MASPFDKVKQDQHDVQDHGEEAAATPWLQVLWLCSKSEKIVPSQV